MYHILQQEIILTHWNVRARVDDQQPATVDALGDNLILDLHLHLRAGQMAQQSDLMTQTHHYVTRATWSHSCPAVGSALERAFGTGKHKAGLHGPSPAQPRVSQGVLGTVTCSFTGSLLHCPSLEERKGQRALRRD